MEIRKIMEKETAIKNLEEIKNKICDVDLDAICGEETSIKDNGDVTVKMLIQAVMCGLVYWDEEKECLCQKLIKPLKSGEIERKELLYKHGLTLGEMKDFRSNSEFEHAIKSLATITACPVHLIEKLGGQDMQIATGCTSFFVK